MAKFQTSQAFADGDQVTSDKLDNIIANLEFAADAVANTTLAVTGGQIKVGTITISEMGANSVGTTQVVDAAVTPAKLSTGGPTWTTGGALSITGNFSISAADTSSVASVTNTSTTTAKYPGFRAVNYNNGTAGHPTFDCRNARGSFASPAVVQSGDPLGIYLFSGWDGSAFDGGAYVVAKASETWSGSQNGTILEFWVTPNGATTPIQSATLTGAGVFNVTGSYQVDGTKVLGNRSTGWGAPTGTATRTAFATSTVTLEQLAQRVKALIDDLTTHGTIGA